MKSSCREGCHGPSRAAKLTMPRTVLRQAFGAKGMERLLHGIERMARARENPELKERCRPAIERALVCPAPIITAGAQGDDRHAVLSEGAGFVGAQHCGGAEGLDRGDAPG